MISDHAKMMIEVRGETAEINQYMIDEARRIVTHAAKMHDVTHNIETYGKMTTFESDAEMMNKVLCQHLLSTRSQMFQSTSSSVRGGSSYLIRRVQEQGGKATFIGVGSDHPDGHHMPHFDIDETSIQIDVDVLAETINRL